MANEGNECHITSAHVVKLGSGIRLEGKGAQPDLIILPQGLRRWLFDTIDPWYSQPRRLWE